MKDLHHDTSAFAQRARQKLFEAGMVAVKVEALDEMHRQSRLADKLAGELERLRAVQAAAFALLLDIDGMRLLRDISPDDYQRHIEALRKALHESAR